jgi:L-fuconolactonase
MTVDSHVHLWSGGSGYDVWIRRKIAGIDRDFTVADLREASRGVDVTAVVLIHATEDPAETPHLLELASRECLIAAVVGWADVTAPDFGHQLDGLMRHPKFRGIRVMPAFGGDPDWLSRPDVTQGFREIARRDLTLDLLLTPAQLPHVLRVKRAVPDLRIMLNHCGRPVTATGQLEPWATALRAVAWSTDICCKLSSLAERAGMDWQVTSLAPYLDAVLDAFGPERVAFGSNWPVVNIAASYAGWWGALEEMLRSHRLSEAARAAIFAGNAAQFYKLS